MMRALALALMLAVAAGVSALGQTAAPRDGAGGAITVESLVGTWTLAVAEQGPSGQATRVQNPRGLLVFDRAGHVFEAITRAARPEAQANGPTVAQQTFATFTGFWGGYTLDSAKRTVMLSPEGGVSPNLMGRTLTRTLGFDGDRLVVTTAGEEPHTPSGTKWTWERVPMVENLSPTYRDVIGFWQHVVESRINLTTKVSSDSKRAPSIIVYTPSGYVGVHFPPLNRQKFAAAEPTDAEAREALRGYVGYFGALSVYPNMVFHQILAGVGTTLGGSTLKRPLELKGSEVTIKFPVTVNQQGQQQTTHVTLRRLSGAADMLPRP
jgi:hypothetical protein